MRSSAPASAARAAATPRRATATRSSPRRCPASAPSSRATSLAPGASTGGPGDPPMHEPGSRETALVAAGRVVLRHRRRAPRAGRGRLRDLRRRPSPPLREPRRRRGDPARRRLRRTAKELNAMPTDAVRQDLGGPRGRAGPALHRPAPRPRGHRARRPSTGCGSPAARSAAPTARWPPPTTTCPPTARRSPRSIKRPARPRPGRDAGEELRGVRRPRLLARLRPPGHRPRDRAGAGRDPAGHDDRLRRQPHRHPRRLRRAGLRHRHERGRARAGHPVRSSQRKPKSMRIDYDGRARLRRHRQGPDPRHDRPDRRRRRRRPRDRVRRPGDRGRSRWRAA